MYKFEDLIEEVKEFNTDLRYGLDDIVGVTIEKGLIPTIANLTQTALDKFYIIKPETFVYNPRTHGVRLGMGYNDTCNTYITTWNNVAFRVKDTAKNIVIPQYLWLYFCRPIWDRLTNFLAWGSSTIVFAWKDFLTIEIDLPSITRQREIVAEYETLTRRIRINEQMIQNLESTAQTLYRKMFVDGIDKENLPEGWRMGTISDFCKEMKSGGTPSRNHNEYWNQDDYPWLKSGEVHNNIIVDVEEYISEAGLKNSSAKIIPSGSVVMAMYGATAAQVAYLDCDTTTNQACCNMLCHSKEDAAYLFFHLLSNQEEIKKLANGGAQENLSQELIAQQPMILLEDNKLKGLFVPILDNLVVRYKENFKLTELQSLLLAKMGK